MIRTGNGIGVVLGAVAVLGAMPSGASAQASVQAFAETTPVPHSGDAADDTAIWVHPDDPASSLIIGTDKLGGLAVYELDGSQRAYLPDGNVNNVDVRYGFPLGGALVDLVVAGNRTGDRIAIYRVDVATRALVNVADGTLPAGLEVYGSCLYRSRASGETYFFVDSKDGEVVQHRLIDRGGRVAAEEVRRFDVGGQVEGCTADDELGRLYVGEEDVGIWLYGAEPDTGTTRTAVDRTGSGGHLTADVEGLTIYYLPDGAGYLLASSQGNNTYTVYERGGDNAFVTSFRITDGEVDGTTDTDGIEVTSASLGAGLEAGLFIAQDLSNPGGNQNHKLVRWSDIAAATTPPLALGSGWDPRDLGEPDPVDPDAGPELPGDDDAGLPMPSRDASFADGGVTTASDASRVMVDASRMRDAASSGGCSVAQGGRPAASTLFFAALAMLSLIARRRASSRK